MNGLGKSTMHEHRYVVMWWRPEIEQWVEMPVIAQAGTEDEALDSFDRLIGAYPEHGFELRKITGESVTETTALATHKGKRP